MLSQQGSIDAADERKKCNTLMDFIKAKGFTIQNVNDFASKGKSVRRIDEHDLFDIRSQRTPCSGSSLKAPMTVALEVGELSTPLTVGILGNEGAEKHEAKKASQAGLPGSLSKFYLKKNPGAQLLRKVILLPV